MPSPTPSRDRLLTIATVAMQIVTIILWVVAGAITIGVLALVSGQIDFAAAFDGKRPSIDLDTLFPMVIAGMIGAIGLLGLGILFMRRLIAIVRTVADDPFVPENAERLRTMAWLLLIIELGGWAVGYAFRWITDPPQNAHELSVTTLVAVISLFVLARVFARGTEMRDEIEGTV